MFDGAIIFWIIIAIYIIAQIVNAIKDSRSRRAGKTNSQPYIYTPPVKPAINPMPTPVKTLTNSTPQIFPHKTWLVGPDEVFKKEYVSYSRLKAFEKCPRMFELVYLYGFEDKSGRAAQLGTLVHEIIKLYTIKYKDCFIERMKNGASVNDLLVFFNQAASLSNLSFSISMDEVIPYLQSFLFLNRNNILNVQNAELDHVSTVGEYNLKCIIDRIDAGQIIVDYKTGNPRYIVRRQLNIYAYSLNRHRWTPYKLMYQLLKTNEVREWNYTARLHHETEKYLLDSIAIIENTRTFNRIPTGLCKYCGVRDQCY